VDGKAGGCPQIVGWAGTRGRKGREAVPLASGWIIFEGVVHCYSPKKEALKWHAGA